MKKPTKKQVTQAQEEIEAEDCAQVVRMNTLERRAIEAENSRRSSLPSEDPEHIHGLMCDGQDGWNSYCSRLRRKLFGEGRE